MDPLTLAVATFGIQKLRGKSTKRALRDAAFIAGGTQLLGSTAFGQNLGISAFGSGAGQISSFGQTGIGSLLGVGEGAAAKKAIAAGNVPAATTIEAGATPEIASRVTEMQQAGLYDTAAADKALSGGIGSTLGKVGSYIKENPGTALIASSALLPLLAGGEDEFELPEGVRPEDYKKAMAKAKGQVEGIGERATYGNENMLNTDVYQQFNQGGIVSVIPKYNSGGINYLPSKVDHDENDVNNYIRATGYVEDGSGNGDKDEDTMLAQLADGEFVSRADAILGAGIMEGASPKDMKDMRKKGAAFFYDQQAKFKRVYDLLDASKKSN